MELGDTFDNASFNLYCFSLRLSFVWYSELLWRTGTSSAADISYRLISIFGFLLIEDIHHYGLILHLPFDRHIGVALQLVSFAVSEAIVNEVSWVGACVSFTEWLELINFQTHPNDRPLYLRILGLRNDWFKLFILQFIVFSYLIDFKLAILTLLNI